MVLYVEIYKQENGEKMVCISEDGSSGAEYPFSSADDIGASVADYLTRHYPNEIENPTNM